MLDHSLAYKILADLVLCREIGEPRISGKNPTGHRARGRRRICKRSVGGRNDGGKLCAIEQIVHSYHGGKILVEGQIELDRIARHERVPLGASSAEKNLKTLEARHLVQGRAIRISDSGVAVQALLADDVHPSGASTLGCRHIAAEG